MVFALPPVPVTPVPDPSLAATPNPTRADPPAPVTAAEGESDLSDGQPA